MTHRIRETDKGLQLTDGKGVLTFSNNELERGVYVSFEGSYLSDTGDNRTFILEGRDNIRDLAEWFLKLERIVPEESSQHSDIQTHCVDEYEHICCIAIQKQKEFLAASAIIDEMEDNIASLSEVLGIERAPKPRVELIAFGYPLGFKEGITPVLLASQKYNQLVLHLDDELRYNRIPIPMATHFGEFVFDGLESIKKKSVFA